MSKKHPTPKPAAAPPAGSVARWLWAAPALALAFGGAVFLLARPDASPLPSAPLRSPAPAPEADDEPEIAAAPPPGPAPDGMVWIPGGMFWMGDDNSPDRDAPVHRVGVSGFWLDTTEVTNAQFAKFVAATKYVTVAERTPTENQYPGAKKEMLVPGSPVFRPTKLDMPAIECREPRWWVYEKGACWNHPEGPGSDLKGRENYPVVHVCWEDAAAYCRWAGKRLPTEAEWECAARGGRDRSPYAWGDAAPGTDGKYFANTFQGKFPEKDAASDGFTAAAPVKTFPPNGYGLYDMSGNVWEWCSDWYDEGYYTYGARRNPKGPTAPPKDEFGQAQKVRRGGSFLCADDYCRRYLPGTRDKNPADSAANHTGFRCAKDGK